MPRPTVRKVVVKPDEIRLLVEKELDFLGEEEKQRIVTRIWTHANASLLHGGGKDSKTYAELIVYYIKAYREEFFGPDNSVVPDSKDVWKFLPEFARLYFLPQPPPWIIEEEDYERARKQLMKRDVLPCHRWGYEYHKIGRDELGLKPVQVLARTPAYLPKDIRSYEHIVFLKKVYREASARGANSRMARLRALGMLFSFGYPPLLAKMSMGPRLVYDPETGSYRVSEFYMRKGDFMAIYLDYLTCYENVLEIVKDMVKYSWIAGKYLKMIRAGKLWAHYKIDEARKILDELFPEDASIKTLVKTVSQETGTQQEAVAVAKKLVTPETTTVVDEEEPEQYGEETGPETGLIAEGLARLAARLVRRGRSGLETLLARLMLVMTESPMPETMLEIGCRVYWMMGSNSEDILTSLSTVDPSMVPEYSPSKHTLPVKLVCEAYNVLRSFIKVCTGRICRYVSYLSPSAAQQLAMFYLLVDPRILENIEYYDHDGSGSRLADEIAEYMRDGRSVEAYARLLMHVASNGITEESYAKLMSTLMYIGVPMLSNYARAVAESINPNIFGLVFEARSKRNRLARPEGAGTIA